MAKSYVVEKFGKLGKEIKISPKSLVSFNKEGFILSNDGKTVSVVVGIGDEHVADLVMSLDAWKALNKGEAVETATHKEFLSKYS
jgi:hypothetical protein